MDNNEVKISISNGEAVAELGERVSAQNYEDIQSYVENYVTEHKDELKAFKFDLRNTLYISSAGLRMFSNINSIVTGNGAKYKLIGLQNDIMRMFKLTGYSSLFKIESLEEAEG